MTGWDRLASAAEAQTASTLDSEPRLELDPMRDMSEPVYPGTVAAWNKHIQMSPKDFCDQILRDLPEGLRITMHLNQDGVGSLEIGPQHGHMSRYISQRNFDARTGEAQHNRLDIADNLQRRGLAALSFRNLLPLYRQLDINRIKVQARGTHAACCWARYGFIPEQSSWTELQGKLIEQAGSDAELAGRIKDMAATDLPAFADTADGAKMLVDQEFDGWLDLSDTQATQRLTTLITKAEAPEAASAPRP
ncbi:MAG: hypothetical protein Alpg2KO_04040 [Alphaproteobacteria bacterium]